MSPFTCICCECVQKGTRFKHILNDQYITFLQFRNYLGVDEFLGQASIPLKVTSTNYIKKSCLGLFQHFILGIWINVEGSFSFWQIHCIMDILQYFGYFDPWIQILADPDCMDIVAGPRCLCFAAHPVASSDVQTGPTEEWL